MRRRSLLAVSASFFLAACLPSAPEVTEAVTAAGPDAVYYLVRHAEKTADTRDPDLTDAGEKRAQDLAIRLEAAPITKIYSSDFIRTRETAAPMAASKKLPVDIYDPRGLSGFAQALLSESGHILVVGHSNTTPDLSALLGGEAGTPIIEKTEYNRLYILTRTGSLVETEIATYGD